MSSNEITLNNIYKYRLLGLYSRVNYLYIIRVTP